MYPLNLFDNAQNLWDLTVNGDDLQLADCITIGSNFRSTSLLEHLSYCHSQVPPMDMALGLSAQHYTP
jgi:hypothetical protein